MSSATWDQPIDQISATVKQRNQWAQAWRRFRRNRLALFGLVWVILVIIAALFAPYLTPWQYDRIDPSNGLAPPSATHWMGADQLGRDMLTRILYATRPMLLVGVVTNVVGVLIGVPLGIFAAYRGGAADWVITRLIDMFSALPWYLIVLYMVMVLSPSLQNLIIALTITSWVGTARIVRGLTFSIRERDFVEAARSLGVPTQRILFRHILPQIAPLVVWSFAAGVPVAVLAEAGLSFIGMGIRPPQPSWGRMLGEAFQYLAYWPHMFIFPATMISLTILAFQGMADGLREAMDVQTNL